jgi:hypothetical protein
MKTTLYAGLILLFAFFACTKDDNDSLPELSEAACYFPLTVGSYWIYNSYEIDSLNSEILISENDTMVITGDTSINGNRYSVFYGKRWVMGTFKAESFRRDSSGYIVNEAGTIVFSQSNLADTLFRAYPYDYDSSIFEYGIMEIFPNQITLPAGTFDSVYNYKLSVVDLDLPDNTIGDQDYLYAPNVGRILRQNFYLHQFSEEGKYYEERLVEYYIAPAK